MEKLAQGLCCMLSLRGISSIRNDGLIKWPDTCGTVIPVSKTQ